jgi:hypothetical protein
MSREIKLPFGRTADGRMVSVEAVERGLACECFCVKCGANLVAAKGEIYQHHFRHYVERADCIGARETALHQFAKQIICDRLQLRLPDPMGVMISAEAECRLGDLVPDVLAKYDGGESVAVEIWVAHQVPTSKAHEYVRRRQAAVEIDLRAYRFAEKSEADWEQAILFNSDRTWLSPPGYIRRQREAERKKIIAAQRKRLAELHAAWEQAERERLALAAEAKRVANEASAEQAEWSAKQAAKEAMWEAERRERSEQERAIRALERLQLMEKRDKEAEYRRVTVERLRQQRRCPDLQELVKVHGTYDRITAEAWEAYDRQRLDWQYRVAMGAFHQQPYCDLPPERAATDHNNTDHNNKEWRRTGAELAQDRRAPVQASDDGFPQFAPVAPVNLSPFGRERSTGAADWRSTTGGNTTQSSDAA